MKQEQINAINKIAKQSSISQVKNAGELFDPLTGESKGIKELQPEVLNEWFVELDNIALYDELHSGNLDLTDVMNKLTPFRSTNWINGQKRILFNRIKATTDYAKSLVFDDVFNPSDRENAVSFLLDSYKKDVKIKKDKSVIDRAKRAFGDFQAFINDLSSKLATDIQYQMDLDLRVNNLETLLVAALINIPIDTSGIIDKQEKLNTINKNTLNLIKKFAYPSTIYNSEAWESSTSKSNQVLIYNDDFKTELDSDLLAPTFNKELKETGVNIMGLQLAEGVYHMLLDKRKVQWTTTLDEMGSYKGDAFQTIFQKRVWYGFGILPIYNGITLVEAPVIPGIRENAKKQIAILKKSKNPLVVKFAKQVEYLMNNAIKFENKFAKEIKAIVK